MKVICVDDEILLLNRLVKQCGEIEKFSEVKGFTKSKEALQFVEDGNDVDLALLDIDMPVINGIDLAKAIKERSPKTAVIFTTAFIQYALDAYNVLALGYLLKPIKKEDILKVLGQLEIYQASQPTSDKIKIRTFGNFEVFVGDKPVIFKRSKAREILAFIVDRMGTGATRPEIAGILWEDGIYDRDRQFELNVYIKSLKKSLTDAGADKMLLALGGRFMIDVDKVDCDIYQYLKGDPEAVNSFNGEYMNEYSWAEVTAGYISAKT